MDNGGQCDNDRYKMDYYKGPQYMWNTMPESQDLKEQSNALVMNKKIMAILAERNAAIQERNEARSEIKEALAARDEALDQREKALAERDRALMDRENALSALHYRENTLNILFSGIHRSEKRPNNSADMSEEMYLNDAFPITTIPPGAANSRQPKTTKVNEMVLSKPMKSPRKAKKVTAVKKSRTEWESQDAGLNLVNFDETTMPVPICTCTGAPHQCYKWGHGGWQSSCCTTTLSQYPLPQMPNKRHSRVGGRKMSGSVFMRLLSRAAAEGHDLLIPLDLKNYWARHGTNRYITIQ